jgi:hypothetical protein
MRLARIYRPGKSAMQSGKAKTKNWILEFEPNCAKEPDRLMGWVTSEDMMADEVRIKFASKEEATGFAERAGIPFEVKEDRPRELKPKSYADNFRPDRIQGNWSH